MLAKEAERVGHANDDPAVDELRTMLPRILATPLGATGADEIGLPSELALAHLEVRDRLDEVKFDLRLGEGTGWRREAGRHAEGARGLEARAGCLDPDAVYAAILAAKGKVPGRAFAAWLEALEKRRRSGRALIGAIPGILTGSIDLVFRTGGARRRHYLVDYKTNFVGKEPGHYAWAWLDRKMAIRGMSGERTPRDPERGRCLGVLGGKWPWDVVRALDAALATPRAVSR
jgi:hypothetical protein